MHCTKCTKQRTFVQLIVRSCQTCIWSSRFYPLQAMLIHLKSWIKTSRHPMVSHTSSLVIIFCLLLLKAVGGSGKASSLMCTTGVPVVSQTSDSRWKCRLSASRGGSIIYAISAAPWRRDLWSLNGSFMLSHPFRLLLLCTASRFTEITRSMSFKLFCLRAL